MKSIVTAIIFTALLTAAPPAQAASFSKEEIEKIVHEYIVNHPEVLMEAIQRGQQQAIDKMQQEAKEVIRERAKEIFNDPASPSVGPKDAKITIVEFFDYNCSACKMMFGGLVEFQEENPDVRIVFKEFPIFGPPSETPAKIALAVHRLYPDRYMEFHTALMSHEGRISAEVVKQAMVSLKLDVDKVVEEAESPKVEAALAKNRELAKALKANGTPLIIIGDDLIPHALDKAGLEGYVKKAKKVD